MRKVMNKTDFCICMETLRKFSAWDMRMYENGIDFCNTPVGELAEKLQLAMCGFNSDWSYDEELGFDWICEWTFNPGNYRCQTRHGKDFDLDTAEQLYDFLVFMNEHGWE